MCSIMNRTLHTAIYILIVLVLVLSAGCASMPEVDRLSAGVPIPGAWSASVTDIDAPVDEEWLASFRDPRLSGLVHEALAHNHDLGIADALLESARARSGMAGSERLPRLDAGMERTGGRAVSDTGHEVEKIHERSHTLGLTMSWEIDLWGRLADLVRAADAEALAAEKDYKAVRLSLAGQVARSWFSCVEAHLQTGLARQNIESYERSLARIRGLYHAGVATALDLHLALAELAASREMLHDWEDRSSSERQSLQLLLGRYPDAAVDAAGDLPDLGLGVPAGLPADLLERRPDIRAARERLLAADWRLSGAEKLLMPCLTLSSSAGTSSRDLMNVLDADRAVYSLMAGITQPLYAGGRIEAGIREADAEARRARLEYGKTVLAALGEVERALDAETHIRSRIDALGEAAYQADRAAALALDQYASGTGDMVTVLESRRRVIQARSELRAAREELLANRIDLHLALGGSFEGTGVGPDPDKTLSSTEGRMYRQGVH